METQPTSAFSPFNGLSKRELLAAMALQAIIAKNPPVKGHTAVDAAAFSFANGAVTYADRLLERLEESA